jgi:hypothetical protein
MTDRAETQDTAADPDVATRRLARESLAADDPTGWFDRLYTAAADGRAVVPWDRGMAHPLLADWVSTAEPDGAGKRALVVGAGTGWDAELIADLGFKAQYQVADLLNPPPAWHRAFDLVVEIFTVQALPIPLQPAATRQVGEQVRAGVEAFAVDDLRLIQLERVPSPSDPTAYRWRGEFLRD